LNDSLPRHDFSLGDRSARGAAGDELFAKVGDGMKG
jgi:hypothetical protein